MKINSVKNENLKDKPENRGEDRQLRNRGLRDLIKILIIRELLGRPGHRPPRPPVRPPFPGGRPGMPPQGPNRPPMMPRNIYDIYEN